LFPEVKFEFCLSYNSVKVSIIYQILGIGSNVQTEFGLFLRINLRSANMQAKDNMRKAAQEEVSLMV